MGQVILDSGVFIASVYPDERFTNESRALIRRLQSANVEFHAPTLLRYELVAVARKAVAQRRITSANGLLARNKLLSYLVTLHFDDALLERAYELAEIYNRPTAYDAHYLALAERLSCEFWTQDERLYNAVNSTFQNIRWLGHL